MEKSQKRSERRYHEKRIQRQRLQNLPWLDVENQAMYGQLKHNHFGCGCPLCKPHKHGLESKYKPSERRKLGNEDAPSW